MSKKFFHSFLKYAKANMKNVSAYFENALTFLEVFDS